MKPSTITIFYHYVLAITAIMSTNDMSTMIASAATLRGSNRNLGTGLKPKDSCGIYAPVYCGTDLEQYANLCLAQLANYAENDCHILVVDTDCAVYAPVVCRSDSTEFGHEFGNICAAEQAGYAESDCTSLPGSNRNLGAVLKPQTSCGVYAPVFCGNDLEQYDNLCLAEQANYSEYDCHILVVDTDCAVYAPVVCGSESTEFGNICAAEQAGYAESDCTSLPGSNRNLDAVIPPITGCGVYAPVRCGGNRLELGLYGNLCLAAQAGYGEHDCIRLY